jgi:murein L,D-transpeptidase YcbB/YkuD
VILSFLRRSALVGCVIAALAPAARAEEGAPLAFRLAVAEGLPGEGGGFYRGRGYAPLWTAPGGEARVAALLAALDGAERHGLPASRWDVDGLRAAMARARTARDAGTVEARLTAAYLDYARALSSGVLTPGEVSPLMVREVERPDPAALLLRMETGDPGRVLRSLVPDSPEYGRLLRRHAELSRVVASGGWGAEIGPGKLEPGDAGTRVVALRDRLRAMGLMERSHAARYDEALAAAVSRFQSRAGLAADGVAGAETLAALDVSARERLGQVLVAMERERWLVRDRGARHVWVNLADFSATIRQDGREVFRTRAVIGKDVADRETPEFSDEMDHLVLNPSWYVPRSIIVNEYLPKLRANPNAVRHLKITDRRGREVDRGHGFAQYSARSFPFSMRQPPGPENALGRVKFMFPNPHNIYLHDTPQRHLFAHDRRAYSHGCIRLAEPVAFAHAILAPQEAEPEALVDGVLRSGAERRVDLDETVPVHLVYRTAFTDEAGALHWREDVYGRDAMVLDALIEAGVTLGSGRGA